MNNSRLKHPSNRSTGNIEEWRLPERMEVVASSGTLHQRAAQPTGEQARVSDFLMDDGRLLGSDEFERELVGGVRVARSATGGLSIRSGRLQEVLAAAETDALVKLKSKPTEDGDV